MSVENKSTTTHLIHPQHEDDLIQHAIRKIPGGKQLFDQYMKQKQTFRTRLPDNRNDIGDGLKHFWS